MHKKPSYWTVLLFSAIVACTVHGQDEAANKVNEALINQIAKEYQTDKILSNDGEIDFNVLNFADALETTRVDLESQNLSDDAYWGKVTSAINAAIEVAETDTDDRVIAGMKKFFPEKITFLRTLGKSNNDALVLLVAGVRKVKELNYDWKKRLGNKVTIAKGGGAAAGRRAAAQAGVPDWYKAHAEHKKDYWEYRAKVREWRRSVHRHFYHHY